MTTLKMLRGTVISYDWYKTAEGQGLLAHLTDPSTGYRQPITTFGQSEGHKVAFDQSDS